MKKILQVTLLRVRKNSVGGLPGSFAEGALVAVTDEEYETLKKNPMLLECFEEIAIKQRPAYADQPTKSTDTPANPETPVQA